MSILNDMLKRLTDNYNKEPNSKIGKLFNIVASELEDLKLSINRTGSWRDIDEAEGKTLDNIGLNVQQFRGQATDEIYRILLKSKIARNLSDGSINTIIQVLAVTLSTDPSEIVIEEKYADALDPEPAAIKLIGLPIARINEVGMSPQTFIRIVDRIVAAGVRVDTIELSGTFELSSTTNIEVDNDTGLADELMTIGGTLGEVYSPGEEIEYPI